MTNPTPQYAELCERLRAAAISASDIQRQMAQAKSLRQGHEPPRDDLYMWPEPEQTLQGQAATALQSLHAENERLRDHIAEQIQHVEQRIEDGKEMGAAVWRIALEDVARENRAALSPDNAGTTHDPE